jgi:hypothetical protein
MTNVSASVLLWFFSDPVVLECCFFLGVLVATVIALVEYSRR